MLHWFVIEKFQKSDFSPCVKTRNSAKAYNENECIAPSAISHTLFPLSLLLDCLQFSINNLKLVLCKIVWTWIVCVFALFCYCSIESSNQIFSEIASIVLRFKCIGHFFNKFGLFWFREMVQKWAHLILYTIRYYDQWKTNWNTFVNVLQPHTIQSPFVIFKYYMRQRQMHFGKSMAVWKSQKVWLPLLSFLICTTNFGPPDSWPTWLAWLTW